MPSRKTNIPAIPTVTDNTASIRRALEATKEAVEVGLGRRGDPLDSFATLRDLRDAGVVSVDASTGSGTHLVRAPMRAGAVGGYRGSGAGVFDPGDPNLGTRNYAPPPAPTRVAAHAMPPNGMLVTWDTPAYANHGYAEVFRLPEKGRADGQPVAPEFVLAAAGFDVKKPVSADNPQPDFAGSAPGTMYSDESLPRTGDGSLGRDLDPTAYWYWVRFVSTAGVPGPYAPLAGAEGQLSIDPAKVLGQLISNTEDQSIYADLLAGYFGTDAWGPILSTHGGLVQYVQSLDGKVKHTIDAQLVRLIGASDNPGGADTLIRMLDNVTGQANATSATLADTTRWQAALATVGQTFAPVDVPMHQYVNRATDAAATWVAAMTHTGMTKVNAGDLLTLHASRLPGVDGKAVRVKAVHRDPQDTSWTIATARSCIDGTPLPITAGYVNVDGFYFATTPNHYRFVSAYADVYQNVMVKVNTDSAIGRAVQGVSAQVQDVQSTVEQTQEAMASLDDTQRSQWMVRMNQVGPNGMLAAAGFGLDLETTPNGDGTYKSISTFLVNANQFAIMGNHAGGGMLRQFQTLNDRTKAIITLNTDQHGFAPGDEAVLSIPDGTLTGGGSNPIARYGGLAVMVREVSGRSITAQRTDASAFNGTYTSLHSGALIPAPNMPFLVDTETQTVGIRGKLVVDGMIRATSAQLNSLTADSAFLKHIRAETLNASLVVAQKLVAGVPGAGVFDANSNAYRSNYVVELNNPVSSNWPLRYWKPSSGVTNFGLNRDGDVFIGGNLSVGENATIATTGDHLLSIGGAGQDTGSGQYDLWIGSRTNYGADGGRRSETNGLLWAKSDGRVGINGDVFLGNYPLSPPDTRGNIHVRPSRDGGKTRVFVSATVNLVPQTETSGVRTVLGARLYLTSMSVQGNAQGLRAGIGYSHGCSRAFLDEHVKVETEYWGVWEGKPLGPAPGLPGYIVCDTQYDFYKQDIINMTMQGAIDVPAGQWKVMVQIYRKYVGQDWAAVEAAFGGSFFVMVAR